MDALTEVYVELYKRGKYDQIPIANDGKGKNYFLTVKQLSALALLKDDHTLSVGYGGSARSGKTVLECFWVLMDSLAFPGVGYGLARKELTILKKTVLQTMFNLLNFYRLVDGVDYKYHEQKNMISFSNGSVIWLIDTAYQPSDPLYTRFGGLELTGCAVDESNESDQDAIGTLLTRCGWRKNDIYGIRKKVLETFNPDRGHVYTRYYEPFKNGTENDFRKFIPALPRDNPHPSIKEWIEDVIKDGDKVRIQRLVYGNFDYSEDGSILVDYDAILEMFDVKEQPETWHKHISTDLAMMGRDKFVAAYWNDGVGKIMVDKDKATAKEIEKDIRRIKNTFNVPVGNIVSDSDGLGAYLESYINNIKQFRGNKRAVNAKDFDNIKSECAWKLAELINNRKIKLLCTDKQAESIKQELMVCLKRDNMDIDDKKKKLIKKPQMKRELGRSPDYFDVLMMYAIYYLTKNNLKKLTVRKS